MTTINQPASYYLLGNGGPTMRDGESAIEIDPDDIDPELEELQLSRIPDDERWFVVRGSDCWERYHN